VWKNVIDDPAFAQVTSLDIMITCNGENFTTIVDRLVTRMTQIQSITITSYINNEVDGFLFLSRLPLLRHVSLEVTGNGFTPSVFAACSALRSLRIWNIELLMSLLSSAPARHLEQLTMSYSTHEIAALPWHNLVALKKLDIWGNVRSIFKDLHFGNLALLPALESITFHPRAASISACIPRTHDMEMFLRQRPTVHVMIDTKKTRSRPPYAQLMVSFPGRIRAL
jgi:hypothetical protein